MENIESQSQQERNIEEDKELFVSAIRETSIMEIEIEFDEQSVNFLILELGKTKLFLLGETHGVKENSKIIYTLFKKFGFRNLALEWGASLQEKVEQFLENGSFDFESIKNSPDGRITAEHFALFKKMREEGILDKIICFNQGGDASWDKRDANMAKNILGNLSDSATLAVAGNLHTKIKSISFEDEEGELHPMGENIKNQIPDVPSGKIEYLAGEFHNYGRKEFYKTPIAGGISKSKFYKSEEGMYIFELSEAHAAIVPNPSEKLE